MAVFWAIAVFIFFMLLIYLPQRRFVYSPVFYPNRSWFKKRAGLYQLHQLPVSEGVTLEYIIYAPTRPTRTIIYFGGKEQDSVGLIQKISLAFPSACWVACNYRGYGKSQGRSTEQTTFDDSLLLFDHIQQQYGAIGLVGFSLGSSVASFVASKRSPRWLVLVAPFDSVLSLIQAKAFFLPGFLIRYKFPTADFVRQVRCPVYVYNSSDDGIVAPRHVARLRKSIPLLSGGCEFSGYTHDALLFSPELKKELREIFQ